MKTTLLMLLMGCGFTKAVAQNSVVINQQGGSSGAGHDVSVVQQGSGNTSVVSQGSESAGNRAVISQSGAGNVATINQGNGMGDSVSASGQSVNVSQSGGGETIINQTDGQNSIYVHQSGLTPADKKKKGRSKKTN